MRSLPPRLVVLLLMVLAPAAVRPSELAQHPDVAPRLELFELWARDQMVHLNQPGVALGIVVGDELIWSRGLGFRDEEQRLPVTADTRFRIGSISKLFTATALLQLRDAGRLRLDDPVSRHLPWFDVGGRSQDELPITLRQLLTHTSGLPREAPFPYWTDRRFPDLEQLERGLTGEETRFAPDAGYQYSNLGIALAGAVVAAASRTDYAAYVRANILAPLGMTRTAVDFGNEPLDELAVGYLIRRPDGSWPVAPETRAAALTPAANLTSTLADLARFVAAQFAGAGAHGALLRAATLREMHRVHWLADDWQSGRGLGFAIWREGERTLVGHGGWVAGYRSQIAFDPAAEIGVVVLTNSDEGGPASYASQAFDFVVPALEQVMRAAAASEPVPLVRPESYVGAYHDPWGAVTEVLVFEGGLVLWDHGYPPRSSIASGITRLEPVAEHTFRRPGGDLVIFELEASGRVVRLRVGENYLFPAGCGRLDADLGCTWQGPDSP